MNSEDLSEVDNDESTVSILQTSFAKMKDQVLKANSKCLAMKEDVILEKKFFKNFMFNPNYDEEIFQKHLLAIHKDTVYCIKGLRQPLSEKKARQVVLCDNNKGNLKTFFLAFKFF